MNMAVCSTIIRGELRSIQGHWGPVEEKENAKRKRDRRFKAEMDWIASRPLRAMFPVSRLDGFRSSVVVTLW